MIVEVNDKKYKVKVAKTEEEQRKGLQGVTELPEDEGMLFIFDPPSEATMWMKDTLIPLDIVFINEDEEVTYVMQGVPETETKVSVQDTAYVLEVNTNSGIKEGDEVGIEDDEDDGPVMKVLAQDGSTQMELKGGERIFRRPFTKQIIKWAKKSLELKDNPEALDRLYIRVGKKMFKEIQYQDNREPEYVEAPKKED